MDNLDELEEIEEIKILKKVFNKFAADMYEVLLKKVYEGKRGWENDSITNIQYLEQELLIHSAKVFCGNGEQLIDVAILSMFLWYHYKD